MLTRKRVVATRMLHLSGALRLHTLFFWVACLALSDRVLPHELDWCGWHRPTGFAAHGPRGVLEHELTGG
jgi:hypothetical protein